MQFTNKTAKLSKTWKGHNIRPHGDEGEDGGDSGELTPARQYDFSQIVLTPKQLDKLVGDNAYHFLFDDSTKPPKPSFASFNRIRLSTAYKDCSIKIVFGVRNSEIEISEDVRIKNITVTIEESGLATLKFTAIAIFPRDLKTLDLENFLGKEVSVSLRLGSVDEGEPEKQQPLELDNSEKDSEPEKEAA